MTHSPPDVTDLVPAVPPGESELWLRDRLRHLLGALGIDSRVRLSPFGLSRLMVIDPLSLDESSTLMRALSAGREAPELPREGAVMWCDRARMVGEVQAPGLSRVLLRSLAATPNEWRSEPPYLRPATLVEIDTARDAR